ncbi:hypothetical protein AVEN_171637-1 [Araneus ventricosus]|uniref:Uncharacterized protein n=1 Tax=Araneus ventricosus TaxID=182803 RepID=A0A4Y2EZ92_ARAVE|nr:hypothetical protein AVEN_171637-1 [Araneus ventricosus]
MVPPVSGCFTKKKKRTLEYPNIPSALRSVSHGEGLPIPETPTDFSIKWTSIQVPAEKFSRLSEAKIKEGVLWGPQIKQLFRDPKFEKLLRSKEIQVWDAFYQVSTNFLRNDKAENYNCLVEDMFALFQNFGCNMSLKIHFLDSHFNFFPDYCGQVRNVFFRTMPTWEKGIRRIGPRRYWLTTIGHSSEMLPTSITCDRPK